MLPSLQLGLKAALSIKNGRFFSIMRLKGALKLKEDLAIYGNTHTLLVA